MGISLELNSPKYLDSWPLKSSYFEDPDPAIQIQSLPLEGPVILGEISILNQKTR